MLDISVTLAVFQEERSRLKVVALRPADMNKFRIFVTLAVFQEERSRLKVVAL